MKRKRTLISPLLAPILVIGSVSMPVWVHAENNPLLTGSPQRLDNGSGYWTTSNIREWLNSNATTVSYTNQAPDSSKLGIYSYDREAGFLSSFTPEEQDAIAVTERRSFINGSSDALAKTGGSQNVPRDDAFSTGSFAQFASPNIQKVWSNIYYQTVHDKVFLLSPYEIYEYLQKRGISLQKELTDSAKTKFNISNNYYAWFSTQARSDVWGENNFAVNDKGDFYYTTPKSNLGIVPALHIKPDYVFQNGKRADSLSIGEKVLFGKYNGEPIEWIVINKTPDGFPLLWSSKILTIKAFDAPGDQSYKNSNSISFPQADVTIKDDLKFVNPNSSDTKPPVIKVVNENDLNSPKGGAWTLVVEATDESGIDSIILPNGNVVKGNRVEYTIPQNGYYEFEAIDNAGNHYGTSIPVGNIEPPASVVIQSSANGWTNKDVTVNIFASDADAGWNMESTTFDGTSVNGPAWPEYSSYAGKRVHITANVRLVSNKDDVKNYNAQVRFAYYARVKSGDDYFVQARYPVAQNIPLSSLLDRSTKPFDVVYTIPNDYFRNLRPVLQVDIAPQLVGLYKVNYTNVKYDLLDKEDFGIEKIILPDGSEVHSNSYTDTLSKEGTYTYKVLDSRGMITEKTVTVHIDKTAPTIDITGIPNGYTKDDIKLQVKANDSLSGVKRILKPNGEWENKDSLEYNVSQNGEYTFKVEDNAGNITTKTITINQLDRVPPKLDAQVSPSGWTNGNVNIQLTATDEEGEVNYIQLPNGNRVAGNTATYTVSQNGDYEFLAEDKMGFQTTKKVTVQNIDKEKPTVQHEITNIDGDQFSIQLKASDSLSGVKRFQLPDGHYEDGDTVSYPARKGESYTFEVEDNAGNILPYTVKVEAPELTVYQKDNHVKAEWAMDMSDQDVIYNTSFEDGQEIPSLLWNGFVGGQSITTEEAYSGQKSLKIDNTYENGNWYNFPQTSSNRSIVVFKKKYFPNGTDLSLSFKAKSNVGGIIIPNGDGGWGETINTLSNTVAEKAGKGSKVIKVDDLSGLYLGLYITTDTDPKSVQSMYQIREIDTLNKTITLNTGLTRDMEVGEKIKTRPWRGAWSFNPRTVPGNNEWTTFSVNTKVGNASDYDVAVRGGTFYIGSQTPGILYVDDVKFGYATKAQLFRGNTKIYEGLLSDYEDTDATDKEKPNPVSNVQVKAKQGNLVMTIQKPEDNGTEYEYTVKSVSNKGDTVSSEKKKVTVVSGIDGYSYVIDKNPSTNPDDTIDIRSEEVTISAITDNQKYYIHIKAIDKEGNASEAIHVPFQDNIAPTINLSQNPTGWTASPVIITVDANDQGLGIRRIKLPDGRWVNGSTTTYTVSTNGTYTFVAEDLVGNQTTKSMTISNIDATPPTAPSISNNQEWTKTTPVSVTITGGTDSQSGVKRVEYKLEGATQKDWTTYTGAFSISNEGETKITARTVDNVGGVSAEAVSYVRIDKSAPHNIGITIKLKP